MSETEVLDPSELRPISEDDASQEELDEGGLEEASGEGGTNFPVDLSTKSNYEDGNAPIADFAARRYLAYAMSVVKGRALPSIEDGQKPVQRRILFAMKELGNWHDASYKKSARIVGDVIGKYHPHGDSSVYEAAVRMAQEFTLRYPLIDGQGNFGSRDGDSAAAMRYTEIRLSKFAEEILMAEMDRGTVDFNENYDGSMKEPMLLPARLPVMLLNGAIGIAVGMATDIPPHNLNEVAKACCEILKKSNDGLICSDEEILDLIPGPDFSEGAQLISSKEDIRKAYSTGRGSLRLRARWTVEQLARGQWQVVVTQLPPCSFEGKDIGDRKVTGAARVLAEIEEMISPKLEKGKKVLSQKQQALKASVLSVLDTARDESDENNPIRIVLEPRTSKVSADEMMAILMANTCLEGNIKVNLVSLGRDGKPLQKGLPEILREWVTFRMDVVERRIRFRYDEVMRRLHILEGRMIAFLNIDKVIKVIRESDEPKVDLMANFSLSEIQAEDILEIRLRQLARLEGIKIEQEIKKLKEEKADLEYLLGNECARRNLIVSEIESDAERHGDHRRTLIEESERITTSKVETIVDEPITVILSKNGFIRSRTGHGVDVTSLGWKTGDEMLSIVETRSTHPVIILDQCGRAYTLKSTDIPGGKGDGIPVTSIIDLQGSKICFMLSAGQDEKVFMSADNSYGFICKISDMVSRQKTGKRFMTIEGEDKVLMPQFIHESDKIIAISSDNRAIIFNISDIKELGGGKGLMIMAMGEEDKLRIAKPYKESVTIYGSLNSGKNTELKIDENHCDKWISKRAKKGSGLPIKFKVISAVKNEREY